ncbi:MAG: hypothetical protein JNK37_15935 [Verrucomicrobiales bacterium]|nr:hypothetical protein [Verrucomicrobiales bacterium]
MKKMNANGRESGQADIGETRLPASDPDEGEPPASPLTNFPAKPPLCPLDLAPQVTPV